MKISTFSFLTMFSLGLVRAGDLRPLRDPEAVNISARDMNTLAERGRSGGECTYGDPLDSSAYSYTEACENPSTCVDSKGGYTVSGYCSGGDDNVCCVMSHCASPYGSDWCADTRYYSCENGEFISGYCPGPSTYKCCA